LWVRANWGKNNLVHAVNGWVYKSGHSGALGVAVSVCGASHWALDSAEEASR
jgi:hypothetical protein